MYSGNTRQPLESILRTDESDAPSSLREWLVKNQTLVTVEIDRHLTFLTGLHSIAQTDDVGLHAGIHAVKDGMVDEAVAVRIDQEVAVLARHHAVGILGL